MRASLLIFYLVYRLNSMVILGAHGAKIQLYKHANFTGLVLESTSNGGCNNVRRDKRSLVYSIRTDTCFIAYYHENCQSYLTEKYLPGDIILSSDQLGRNRLIISFHTCNEDEGGNQLNVDITQYKNSSKPSKVLETYKNVCSCVNVPQTVLNMSKWSIDNHHNDLLAYYKPDCSVSKWNPKFIPAGHNWYFTDMHLHKETDSYTKKTYSVKSFGPNPNSAYFVTSCNSSHVFTTDTTRTTESTTKRETDLKAGVNCQGYQVLANQFAELKTQVDRLERNQEKFQNDILQAISQIDCSN